MLESERLQLFKNITLRDVDEIHHPGIVSDLHLTIQNKIDSLANSSSEKGTLLIDFFNHLKKEISSEMYEEIQLEFLSNKKPDKYGNMIKYLDSTLWFKGKMTIIMKTNLHNREPMKILDIGAGCGHFAFLAKFFGHDAHATNPPRIKLRPKGEDRHLYHALCNLYQIESHELMIHAKQAITGIAERFDMITALMVEFNHIAGTPWGVEEWDFFLDDIKGCLLKPGGIIFLGLTRGKLSAESWSYLKSRATWYDEKGKHIFIKT